MPVPHFPEPHADRPGDARVRTFVEQGLPHAEIAVRLGLSLTDAKRRIAALSGEPPEPLARSSARALPHLADPNARDAAPAAAPTGQEATEEAPHDEPRRVSRRTLLGVAAAAALSAAGGGLLATRPTREVVTERERTLRPVPTVIPPTPSPLALAERTADVFERLTYAPGAPIDADHGIFFVPTGQADEASVEGWRQTGEAPPRGYRMSPGRRFVTGGNALLDRRTGQQFTWPEDKLWLRGLSDERLLFAELHEGRAGVSEPSGRHHVTDAELQPIASLETSAEVGGGPEPLFSTSGARIYLAMTDQLRTPVLALLDVPSSRVQSTLTLASQTSSSRFFSGPLTAARDGSAVLVRLALLPWGRRGGAPAASRSLIVRYSWEGDLLSRVAISIGSSFPSPDGSLIVGDQITQAQKRLDDGHYVSASTMLVAETATARPVFRLRGAYGNYGDRLDGTRWLADSSGFVALIGSPGEGTAYAIVNRDGSIRATLPPPPLLDNDPWYRSAEVFAPVPAPDDPALFSYGRTALLDLDRGRWRRTDLAGASGPAHLDPWGDTSAEMVLALPHPDHPLREPPELDSVDVQYPPFAAHA